MNNPFTGQPSAQAASIKTDIGYWLDSGLRNAPTGEIRWVEGPLGKAGNIDGVHAVMIKKMLTKGYVLRIPGFQFFVRHGDPGYNHGVRHAPTRWFSSRKKAEQEAIMAYTHLAIYRHQKEQECKQ